MLIDWFTVVAQLINFLILVFLLHRLLYQPIVRTIRSRQEEIDRHWQEAREEKQMAQEEIALYQEKKKILEQQREVMTAQAKQEAEQEYQQLIQQARQEVKQKQLTWENAIAQQREQFYEDLEQKLTNQVYEIALKAFQELADASLEQQIIRTFIRRLQNLGEQERQSLAKCLQESDNELLICSSFELSPETRHQIIDCLHQQQIYHLPQVRFARVPELICGIELQAKSYKVPWNLKSYLFSLQKHEFN